MKTNFVPYEQSRDEYPGLAMFQELLHTTSRKLPYSSTHKVYELFATVVHLSVLILPFQSQSVGWVIMIYFLFVSCLLSKNLHRL